MPIPKEVLTFWVVYSRDSSFCHGPYSSRQKARDYRKAYWSKHKESQRELLIAFVKVHNKNSKDRFEVKGLFEVNRLQKVTCLELKANLWTHRFLVSKEIQRKRQVKKLFLELLPNR